MGAPVSRCASATARNTRAQPAVMPRWSEAHLRMAALTPVPPMPSVRSRTKNSLSRSGPPNSVPGPRLAKYGGRAS